MRAFLLLPVLALAATFTACSSSDAEVDESAPAVGGAGSGGMAAGGGAQAGGGGGAQAGGGGAGAAGAGNGGAGNGGAGNGGAGNGGAGNGGAGGAAAGSSGASGKGGASAGGAAGSGGAGAAGKGGGATAGAAGSPASACAATAPWDGPMPKKISASVGIPVGVTDDGMIVFEPSPDQLVAQPADGGSPIVLTTPGVPYDPLRARISGRVVFFYEKTATPTAPRLRAWTPETGARTLSEGTDAVIQSSVAIGTKVLYVDGASLYVSDLATNDPPVLVGPSGVATSSARMKGHFVYGTTSAITVVSIAAPSPAVAEIPGVGSRTHADGTWAVFGKPVVAFDGTDGSTAPFPSLDGVMAKVGFFYADNGGTSFRSTPTGAPSVVDAAGRPRAVSRDESSVAIVSGGALRVRRTKDASLVGEKSYPVGTIASFEVALSRDGSAVSYVTDGEPSSGMLVHVGCADGLRTETLTKGFEGVNGYASSPYGESGLVIRVPNAYFAFRPGRALLPITGTSWPSPLPDGGVAWMSSDGIYRLDP